MVEPSLYTLASPQRPALITLRSVKTEPVKTLVAASSRYLVKELLQDEQSRAELERWSRACQQAIRTELLSLTSDYQIVESGRLLRYEESPCILITPDS